MKKITLFLLLSSFVFVAKTQASINLDGPTSKLIVQQLENNDETYILENSFTDEVLMDLGGILCGKDVLTQESSCNLEGGILKIDNNGRNITVTGNLSTHLFKLLKDKELKSETTSIKCELVDSLKRLTGETAYICDISFL